MLHFAAPPADEDDVLEYDALPATLALMKGSRSRAHLSSRLRQELDEQEPSLHHRVDDEWLRYRALWERVEEEECGMETSTEQTETSFLGLLDAGATLEGTMETLIEEHQTRGPVEEALLQKGKLRETDGLLYTTEEEAPAGRLYIP